MSPLRADLIGVQCSMRARCTNRVAATSHAFQVSGELRLERVPRRSASGKAQALAWVYAYRLEPCSLAVLREHQDLRGLVARHLADLGRRAVPDLEQRHRAELVPPRVGGPMASLPSGVIATACGGPCTVCSRPTSTVALTTGGNFDASRTTRLSRGAGSGNVATSSTRTNLPSCAERMRSAAWTGRATRTARPRARPRVDARWGVMSLLRVVVRGSRSRRAILGVPGRVGRGACLPRSIPPRTSRRGNAKLRGQALPSKAINNDGARL